MVSWVPVRQRRSWCAKDLEGPLCRSFAGIAKRRVKPWLFTEKHRDICPNAAFPRLISANFDRLLMVLNTGCGLTRLDITDDPGIDSMLFAVLQSGVDLGFR